MTGENGVVTWNPKLRRYFLPNFSFLDNATLQPVPYHVPGTNFGVHRSQVTIFESENPWGPWRLVWKHDDAARHFGIPRAVYTPSFPAKFIDESTGDMYLAF